MSVYEDAAEACLGELWDDPRLADHRGPGYVRWEVVLEDPTWSHGERALIEGHTGNDRYIIF